MSSSFIASAAADSHDEFLTGASTSEQENIEGDTAEYSDQSVQSSGLTNPVSSQDTANTVRK